MVGDLIVSSLPNTGNPNKVQRYTLEWAEALEANRRAQTALSCCPAMARRIAARTLRRAADRNGARACASSMTRSSRGSTRASGRSTLSKPTIELPPDLAAKPYLRPSTDACPFVVRDVIRRYAGWWSGEPSQMFPATRKDRADDIIALCGRDKILERARNLRAEGHLKRALALAEMAVNANPDDTEAVALNAEILEAMAASERSFIARNFYTGAARALRERLG